MAAFEIAMMNWGRLLLDGIPYADLLEASERDPDQSWLQFWTRKADIYQELGERAASAGHSVSAGEFLWLASLCCQYAQFLWFDGDRAAIQDRKVRLYEAAAPLLKPAAERVELTVGNVPMPCYLRRPEDVERPPCVILLGGLESTKEESYQFENLLLRRGMATLTFDGPGQGEMLARVPLSDDFQRYTSTAVDHLIARPDIDGDRIGILGRSLGGTYALRSASHDARLKACVSWGGSVAFDWDSEPDYDRASWQYVTKTDTEEETREIVERSLDNRPFIHQLRCPTYFLHGDIDPTASIWPEVPMFQVDLLRKHAVNAPLTIVVEPQGDHCCHNLGPRPRLQMADWLSEQLAIDPGAGRRDQQSKTSMTNQGAV